MSDARKDLPPVNSPNFLEKVREALSVYLGNRGNKLDRGLTLRDLSDAGIIDVNARYLAGGGSSPIGGVGSAVSRSVGVYEEDLTPPPTPTGFAAAAAISNLILTSDAATYTQGHGHAKARLYGATWTSGPLPVFASAVRLTEFTGTVGSYATNPATTWRLWLTWVTVDGVESIDPAGGTNGIAVTTGQDVALLVEAMTGPGNPFTIVTEETIIDGVTFPAGTYSTKAFIQDLQVTTAKVKELDLDNARVSKMSVSKLTAGTIDTGDIKSTHMTEIGGIACPSFTINASTGLATFNNAVVRGTVYATAGLIGGNTIDATSIHSGSTGFGTGGGFYLGSDGRFSLSDKLTWNGSALAITGALTATTIATASGKFAVSAGGVLTATEGNFSGSITGSTINSTSQLNGVKGTFSGTLTAEAINAVNTINISGGAITEHFIAQYSSSSSTPGTVLSTLTFTVPSGQTWQITTTGTCYLTASTGSPEGTGGIVSSILNLQYAGVTVNSASVSGSANSAGGNTPSVKGSGVVTVQHTAVFTSGQSITIRLISAGSYQGFTESVVLTAADARMLVFVSKR